MIYLWTGSPGAGKTQFALALAVEFKAKGRAVYVFNVNGLDLVKTGFFPLDEPSKWQELPDNSVVVLDEAYAAMPQRDYKKGVPAWIESLATHRHRGFDFIIVCQHGSQIDHFVRRLVGQHNHVKRKTSSRSLVVTWDRYEEKPDDYLRQMNAQKGLRKFDKSIWELYTSATQHTHKSKIPWQVWLVACLIPLCLFLFLRGAYGLTSEKTLDANPPAQAAESAPAPAALAGIFSASEMVPVAERRMTAMEWVEHYTPRVEGIPDSAPAYDGFAVVDYPRPLCIEVKDTHCRCYTQQVTRLDIPQDLCLRIVHEGLWDPRRKPFQSMARESGTGNQGQTRGAASGGLR